MKTCALAGTRERAKGCQAPARITPDRRHVALPASVPRLHGAQGVRQCLWAPKATATMLLPWISLRKHTNTPEISDPVPSTLKNSSSLSSVPCSRSSCSANYFPHLLLLLLHVIQPCQLEAAALQISQPSHPRRASEPPMQQPAQIVAPDELQTEALERALSTDISTSASPPTGIPKSKFNCPKQGQLRPKPRYPRSVQAIEHNTRS